VRDFGVLLVEALRDAARRRLVAAIAALCLLTLFMLESCTACQPVVGSFSGVELAPARVTGFLGALLMAALGFWTLMLAAFLAADHLRQALDDGSAGLVLARPVGRAAFALARLAGALLVALAAGLSLLGAAGFLLHARHGLSLAPVAWSAAATAAGALAAAGLAMAASLWLPRAATWVCAIAALDLQIWADLASLRGAQPEGLLGLLSRYGPPVARALALALAPWTGLHPGAADAGEVSLRLLLWGAAGVGLLVLAFRRREIEV